MKKNIIKAVSLILIVALCLALIMCVKAIGSEPELKIRAFNLSFSDTVYLKYAVSAKNVQQKSVKLLIWLTSKDKYISGSEDACISDSYTETL